VREKSVLEDIIMVVEAVNRIEDEADDSDGVTVVLWTSSHILYGLPLHQKGNVSKATC